MIVQIVKVKGDLTDSDVGRIAEDHNIRFQALPGLIEKYYVREAKTGQYAGILVWQSREALEAFQGSELAQSIESAYDLTEPPQIEEYEVLTSVNDA